MELGWIDILLEVSLLSQYLVAPRVGHMEAAYHVFAYLKSHPTMKLVFDDLEPPGSSDNGISREEWFDFYGNVAEELPPNMP